MSRATDIGIKHPFEIGQQLY
jgi:hypothetical protein